MKTKFKRGIFLPLATLVLGVAGAFATTSMASVKDDSVIKGRYFVNQNDPCHLSTVDCSDTFTTNGPCTSGGITYWKMNEAPSTQCTTPLYKILP